MEGEIGCLLFSRCQALESRRIIEFEGQEKGNDSASDQSGKLSFLSCPTRKIRGNSHIVNQRSKARVKKN